MKIIFISRPTFFSPMKERLILKNELDNYDIEYWSTYFLYNKINPYSFNKENIKTIILKNKKDLFERSFEVNKEDIIITTEEINYINYKFFEKLYQKNIKIIFFYPENIPNIKDNENMLKKIKKNIFPLKNFSFFLQKLIDKLTKEIYRYKICRINKNIKNSIFLISGKNKEKEVKNKINIKDNKFISIMSRDLIEYKKTKVILSDQIVFIDQYLPYHPDFKLANINFINSDLYYKYLNDFFEKIEKKYKMGIVIAAHPSSNYTFNPFNNRKIIKYKTVEEIKKSKFVIGHYSTSLGLVTVEKKPLIIINMDIFPNLIKNCINTFSKELGIIPINLTSNNIKINFEKNDIFYENYYINYLYQGKKESIPINEILKIINRMR